MLDEASTAQLLDRLTLDVLLQAAGAPDSALGQALATAIVVAADQTFKDVVGDAIKQRDAIAAWIARAGGIEQAIAGLSHSFGLAPDDSAEKVEQDYFAGSLIPASEWPALIELLAQGGKSDKNHIDALDRRARRQSAASASRIICECSARPSLPPRKSLLTKSRSRAPSRLAGAPATGAGARLRPHRARARACRPRPHRSADHHRQGGDRPLRPGEGAARAARLR